MIDVPELGRLGFQHLLAATEARLATERKKSAAKHAKTPAVPEKAKPLAPPKEDCRAASHRLPKDLADEFQKYAEKVLLAEAQPKLRHFPGGMTQYSSSYASDADDPDEIDFRCPEEYLATMAWRSGDWGRIDKVLLPKLDQARDRRGCKLLRQLASLYRCASKDYLAAAAPIAKEPRSGDGLAIVVDVWLTRGLTVDLQPMILDSLRRGVRRMTDQETPTLCPIRYLERLAAQGRMKQAEEAIEEVAEVCLGPLEKRAEFVKRGFPGRRPLVGRRRRENSILFGLSPAPRAVVCVLRPRGGTRRVVQGNCGERRDLEWFLSKRGTACKTQPDGSRGDAGSLALDGRRGAVPRFGARAECLAMAHRSSPGEPFRRQIGAGMEDAGREAEILSRLRPGTPPGDPCPTDDEIATGASRSGGRRSSDRERRYAELRRKATWRHREAADAAADGRRPAGQRECAGQVADGSATGAARQWLERQLTARSLQIVDKFRKAKKIEELGLQNPEPSELGQYFGGVLPGHPPHRCEDGLRVFSRTVTLYQAYQKSPRAQNTFYPSSYSYETTPAGVILEQTLTQCNGEGVEPKVLLFVVNVLGIPAERKYRHPRAAS